MRRNAIAGACMYVVDYMSNILFYYFTVCIIVIRSIR